MPATNRSSSSLVAGVESIFLFSRIEANRLPAVVAWSATVSPSASQRSNCKPVRGGATTKGLFQELIDDLNLFVQRRDYFRSVVRAWKCGYLLYGPPGTGKSSLVAAIESLFCCLFLCRIFLFAQIALFYPDRQRKAGVDFAGLKVGCGLLLLLMAKVGSWIGTETKR
ncbi:unnamed protein product [Linum trigynum]|uniref:ATPase AAA-type core domain-containing protein n=1 Tax=Linum trigynum TaxID=586398 RepID=A0AAV2FUF3_9ROSI